MISGKRLFLELLQQEGVGYIFGNPGTTELPLMDALAVEPRIRYVLGLQEATVLGMADGFAQATGRLAVVSLHAAPGLGNAIGALHNARKAGVPLIVTAGQQDLSYNLTEPNLWADLLPIAQPFVKWAYEPRTVAELPRVIHRAAKTALASPAGPVFISLPADLLNAEADVALGSPTRIGTAIRGDADAIARAADALVKAERPVIVAGDAVAQRGAQAELLALAQTIGAPVYAEGIASRAVFPPHHGLYRGPLVRLAAQIRAVLEQHDLLLSIGGDLFTLSLPGEIEPLPSGMPIVHLDTDPWELGKNYPTAAAILGDPRATLPDLIAAVAGRMTPAGRVQAESRAKREAAAGLAQLEKLRQSAVALEGAQPIHPLALMHAIAQALPSDAVVVDEAISSAGGLHRFLNGSDPQAYFGNRGGGIGWGLPAAIGVQLALPERRVVALIGDGSAMYSIQALYTAARERIPVVFVIVNNSSYRILKQRINAMKSFAAQTDAYIGMDLTDPAIGFVDLARGLGLAAHRATTLAAVRDLLAAALAEKTATLIEVEVDRSFKPL
jgi:benzoylformate decarboxylase